MNYVKRKIVLPTLIAIVLIVSIFLLKSYSFAQGTTYDLTVSPIFFDLATNPGTTVSNKIRIRNNGSSPIPLKLEIQRLSSDTNGNLSLKQEKNDYTLSWIKFSKKTFVAKPLEWTEVPFSIDVPKDAAYGYYWTITFSQDNANPLAKNGVVLSGAAGTPILLNVRKDGAKAEAKITKFETASFISEYLPVEFKIAIENKGNIHIRPHGNIFISDGRNKDLAILNVNEGLGNVIPGSLRVFNASWDDGFLVKTQVMEDGQPKLDKNGKTIEKISINWNKLTSFRIGKYTANLLLIFDNGKKDIPLEATITFWILPWKALVVILLFLIFTFFLIRWLLRIYISREIKKRAK